jgi:hypothetical protein
MSSFYTIAEISYSWLAALSFFEQVIEIITASIIFVYEHESYLALQFRISRSTAMEYVNSDGR